MLLFLTDGPTFYSSILCLCIQAAELLSVKFRSDFHGERGNAFRKNVK